MILFLLFLLFRYASPLPSIEALGSRRFAERERADRELRRYVAWWNVSRLERLQIDNPEVRWRVDAVVYDYRWRDIPGPETAPYIDSLNFRTPCDPPNTRFVEEYLRRADRFVPLTVMGMPLLRYRVATSILVDDWLAWRVPGCVIRWALCWMQARSAEWDARRKRNFQP